MSEQPQQTIRLWGHRAAMPPVVKALLETEAVRLETELENGELAKAQGNRAAHERNRARQDADTIRAYLKAAA